MVEKRRKGSMKYPEPEAITLDDETHRFIMDRLRERLGVGKPREGYHVSDLLYCMLKQWATRRLQELPRDVLEQEPDETVLVWVIGRSHEDLLGQDLKKEAPREKDGITGSVDRWLGRTVEMKSTRMSAKKDLLEMPHYIAQAAAYCVIYEETECTILVFHLMGDYYHQTTEGKAAQASPAAKLRVYKVSFEKETLDAWWDELLRRKAILEGDEQPEVDEVYSPMWEWECQYCRVGKFVSCPKWQELDEKRRQSLERARAKQPKRTQAL